MARKATQLKTQQRKAEHCKAAQRKCNTKPRKTQQGKATQHGTWQTQRKARQAQSNAKQIKAAHREQTCDSTSRADMWKQAKQQARTTNEGPLQLQTTNYKAGPGWLNCPVKPPTTTNYMVFGPIFAREACPTFKNRQHMRTKDKHMRTHRLTQLRERQRTGKDTQLHWEMHGSLGERQRMG